MEHMPMEYMSLFFPAMRIAAATAVLLAVFFAFKLYRETDKGWYWGTLVLSALFFALAQWLFIFLPFTHGRGGPLDLNLLRDASEILASLLFAVSCYGMWRTMHIIRKRVE